MPDLSRLPRVSLVGHTALCPTHPALSAVIPAPFTVITAPSTVIPAKAGIQARCIGRCACPRQLPRTRRRRMDPRLRGDDVWNAGMT